MSRKEIKPEDMPSYIDHTLLRTDASNQEIKKLCEEAIEYGFKSVCVNLYRLSEAVELLKGENPIPITVIGFPLGATTSSIKMSEAETAVKSGAAEIDMVMNIGALKDKRFSFVAKEISSVVSQCGKVPVKVILETYCLARDEKITACKIVKDSGAAFVKTSTGFSAGGATVEDIALMRETVGPIFGVKASGGIKTFEDALRLIAAGADRLGTSQSVAIVCRGKSDNNSY